MSDILNVNDVPLRQSHSKGRFQLEEAFIGYELGLHGLGCTLLVVPPGKVAWPFHRHHVADEMFYILSGTGEYRIGENRIPVKPGDCLGAPAGGKAHQIINTGSEPLRYLALSNNTNADVIDYPDTNTIGYDAMSVFGEGPTTGGHFRATAVDYWDGEDTGDKT